MPDDDAWDSPDGLGSSPSSEETLDLDKLDESGPGSVERGEVDPHIQKWVDQQERKLRFLDEVECGPVEMVPVEKDYHGESGLQNIVDALADKLTGQSLKTAEELNLPTIWYHGERSYSTDGKTPRLVPDEEDNILQCFLDRDIALDTNALSDKSGTVNVAAAISRIVKQFGNGAIRRPRKKGDGYFIRVRTRLPTR